MRCPRGACAFLSEARPGATRPAVLWWRRQDRLVVDLRLPPLSRKRLGLGHGPKRPSVRLNFILIEEIAPPPGEKPVRWLLATALPVENLEEEFEWKPLWIAVHARRRPLPVHPPTLREAVRMIAQLGGFLGRKCDGEPGPQTLWRGLRRLHDLTQGWLAAHDQPKAC